MEDLRVHQDYKKQGIVERLFIEAKKRILELMAWEFNKNALAFYENQGLNIRSKNM